MGRHKAVTLTAWPHTSPLQDYGQPSGTIREQGFSRVKEWLGGIPGLLRVCAAP
jgi:hypothetical protein